MWEQIRSNRRKSSILVVSMALLLLGLGYVLAEYYAPGAGVLGLGAAFALWLVLTLVAYFQGDRILLAVSGAKKIEKDDHLELFNVVEEMTIASGLSKMPDIYIIEDTAMNAFATGRKPEKAAVAVTAGLLGRLNRDELQGVVGHEVAHIVNRDVMLMSMVGVMLGAIVMLSETFLRSLWFTGGRGARFRSRGSRKGGGQGQAVVAIIAIVLAILAPILAQLIYLAVSRKREYLADASSAVYTRYPDGLASALEQLGGAGTPVRRANRATAAMYIVNPFKKKKLSALTRTHPPTEERIRILRGLGGMATYQSYQEAWSQAAGEKAGDLPGSALSDTEHGGKAREADPRARKKSPREQAREVGDLLRDINHFIFLPCVCGLKLKIPPEYKHDTIQCPKCKRRLEVPVAQLAAAQTVAENLPGGSDGGSGRPGGGGVPLGTAKGAGAGAAAAGDGAPLKVQRTPGEWMTFKCSCGKSKTLSPGFSGSRLQCKNCGREIELV